MNLNLLKTDFNESHFKLGDLPNKKLDLSKCKIN